MAHARRRKTLAAFLLAELICALLLIGGPASTPQGPAVATQASLTTPTAPTVTAALPGGRTARLVALGGPQTAPLLDRIRDEIPSAVEAVTAFWGPDWRRDILVVATGSDDQFRVLAGGDTETAATTTPERITFAPGAAQMDQAALRLVLRHELFHYAARADTAVDAPVWLTEGVADFVGRPMTPAPPDAAALAVLPSDADLAATGPARSLAYDRAWWFSRFVAEEYGATTLRELYQRACGHGHTDVATAVRDTLGASLDDVLVRWRQWTTG